MPEVHLYLKPVPSSPVAVMKELRMITNFRMQENDNIIGQGLFK